MVLQNNGGSDFTVAGNGPFTFPASIAQGLSYQVSVLMPPSGQLCAVTGGNGVITSNVSNIGVTCSAIPVPTFSIGGIVSGLVGNLVLRNNGADDLTLSANGDFTFAQRLPSAATYAVSVSQQPASQTCVVNAGTGAVGAADVGSVRIQCSTPIVSRFSVGGTVSGLSGNVVLRNNAGDDLAISTNGSFIFSELHESSSNYAVTVFAQPLGQHCIVTAGAGTILAANIVSVAVNCSHNTYGVGGRVTGLSGTVLLQTGGGDELSLAADGAFEFPTELRTGQAYEASVRTQPAAARCVIKNGSGTVAAADVTSIEVVCRAIRTSRYAYVLNAGSYPPRYVGTPGFISQFAIGADGTLTPMLPSTVAACDTPADIVVEPAGRFLYVSCPGRYDFDTNVPFPSTIAQFEIGPDGRLAPLAPASISVTGSRRSLLMHRSGQFVYATGADDSIPEAPRIWQYQVDSAGQLAAMTPDSVAIEEPPSNVAIDSTGRNLYALTHSAGHDESLLRYTIDASGLLHATAAPELPSLPTPFNRITLDPFDRFLYVADGLLTSRIDTFELDAAGHLVAQIFPPAYPVSVWPSRMAAEPGGRYLYVGTSVTISQFEVSPVGLLSALTPASVPGQSPTVDSSGRYLYGFAGFGSGDPQREFIVQYTIGAQGTLTPMTPASIPSGPEPLKIVTSP